jgi:hypothetical protein
MGNLQLSNKDLNQDYQIFFSKERTHEPAQGNRALASFLQLYVDALWAESSNSGFGVKLQTQLDSPP